MDRNNPLYRKVNSRTHGANHGHGGEYRWARHTKAEQRRGLPRGSMHPGLRHGLDYTPLFRFLLSRVGHDFRETHREALSRLDREQPIFWMVARGELDRKPYICIGESSYFSGLYVDENNMLALVDAELTANTMKPTCHCCTHTFNGELFTQVFEE